jgi:hypothetical protein
MQPSRVDMLAALEHSIGQLKRGRAGEAALERACGRAGLAHQRRWSVWVAQKVGRRTVSAGACMQGWHTNSAGACVQGWRTNSAGACKWLKRRVGTPAALEHAGGSNGGLAHMQRWSMRAGEQGWHTTSNGACRWVKWRVGAHAALERACSQVGLAHQQRQSGLKGGLARRQHWSVHAAEGGLTRQQRWSMQVAEARQRGLVHRQCWGMRAAEQ